MTTAEELADLQVRFEKIVSANAMLGAALRTLLDKNEHARATLNRKGLETFRDKLHHAMQMTAEAIKTTAASLMTEHETILGAVDTSHSWASVPGCEFHAEDCDDLENRPPCNKPVNMLLVMAGGLTLRLCPEHAMWMADHFGEPRS
jgi:hypothetical protein